MEVLWTGLGSIVSRDPKLTCRTSVWMFPIYGMAAFLSPHQQTDDWQKQFIGGGMYTLLIFATEYATGAVLKKFSPLPLGLQPTACKYPWINQPVLYTALVWRRSFLKSFLSWESEEK